MAERISLLLPYLSVSPDTKMTLFTQEQSFDLDKAYYAAVAFIGFLFIGHLLTKWHLCERVALYTFYPSS